LKLRTARVRLDLGECVARVRCAGALKLLVRNRSGFSFRRRSRLGLGSVQNDGYTRARRVPLHNPSTDSSPFGRVDKRLLETAKFALCI
jgi:hypothetical protein